MSPFAIVVLALSVGVYGDLSSTVRQARHQQVVTVPLRLFTTGNGQRRHLLASVSVGSPPQVVETVLDTASGHMIVNGGSCSSPACVGRPAYAWWSSTSTVHLAGPVVDLSYTQSDLGSGVVGSRPIGDEVCLAGACRNMSFLAALYSDVEPFASLPGSGFLGLGLTALAFNESFSLLPQILEGAASAQFGISLARQELHVGGHLAGLTPVWSPVWRAADGYWQVRASSVRIGTVEVNACEDGCRVIIDTGASNIGADEVSAAELRTAAQAIGGCANLPLVFDLEGPLLMVNSGVYTTDCAVDVGTVDIERESGVYVLGVALLNDYYVAFDWARHMVGFAPLEEPKQEVLLNV